MKILITANDHRYYNQVVTVLERASSPTGSYWVAELSTGERTTVRDGEYKITKQQD
jgi:hypothetical protein